MSAEKQTLAERIGRDLFTDGCDNSSVARLALVRDEEKPCRMMSGWCERAVVDRINLALLTSPELRQVEEALESCQPAADERGDLSLQYYDRQKITAALAALRAIRGGEK